jgi:hypothetical protein
MCAASALRQYLLGEVLDVLREIVREVDRSHNCGDVVWCCGIVVDASNDFHLRVNRGDWRWRSRCLRCEQCSTGRPAVNLVTGWSGKKWLTKISPPGGRSDNGCLYGAAPACCPSTAGREMRHVQSKMRHVILPLPATKQAKSTADNAQREIMVAGGEISYCVTRISTKPCTPAIAAE